MADADHPAPTFARYIGIDYSGAQTPTVSLQGLRVYMAEGAQAHRSAGGGVDTGRAGLDPADGVSLGQVLNKRMTFH
jgi:hypothetical protein